MLRHGLVDQSLHLLALSRSFRIFSFDRECRRNRLAANPQRKNLFIAGMARAGSTTLLNTIFAGGEFAATTYAQMPFVLAPSLAGRLASISRSNGATTDRAHGDGIQVSAGSPEALDGIFWSTFFPLQTPEIQPRRVPEPILQKYAKFIENQLAGSESQRYLCKMNQGIDKLESLADFFPQSIFLLPFREPQSQAISLLRQHHRFSNLSWYEKRYLDWQQHYEFGDLHRKFSTDEISPSPDRPDYWLEQWRLVYTYLFDLASRYDNLIPLAYESLADSAPLWQKLERKLNLNLDRASFLNRNPDNIDRGLTLDTNSLDRCNQLYDQLSGLSETRLC